MFHSGRKLTIIRFLVNDFCHLTSLNFQLTEVLTKEGAITPQQDLTPPFTTTYKLVYLKQLIDWQMWCLQSVSSQLVTMSSTETVKAC